MNRKNIFRILSILCLLVISACNKDNNITPIDNPTVSQGSRILGMDIKEVPSVNFGMAYDLAITIGARESSISLDWGLLETTVGNYDNTLPDIIDSFYPSKTGDITFVLRPLDTPGPRLPSDLAGSDFDDPAVISAFENFLTNLHAQVTTLNSSGKLKWIHVGNEIDSYLGIDATKWSQWETFFNAAKSKIESLWGVEVKVSSVIQFSTLKNSNMRTLYQNLLPDLDDAVLTYYPLNVDFTMSPPSIVTSDFDFMVNTIQNKSIILQECGYPSSSVNNSSELLQADFITSVFEAWDTHRDRISHIEIAWQYDVSEATVDQWVIDFGMTGHPNENAFKHYLWTLGLSNYNNTEKLALQRLRKELQSRSWNQ